MWPFDAGSQFIKEYMKDKSSLPCEVVVNGIDLDVFHPRGRQKDSCKVIVLNRRNIADAREAITLIPEAVKKKIEFVILENQYTQAEIAEFFRKADIFLAIGYPEGFALPPLEAMASGCAVVGFTGGGGIEHMIDGETALVASDGNVQELAACLRRIVEDAGLKDEIRSAGMKKAHCFSLENMEKQVVQFAGSILAAALKQRGELPN